MSNYINQKLSINQLKCIIEDEIKKDIIPYDDYTIYCTNTSVFVTFKNLVENRDNTYCYSFINDDRDYEFRVVELDDKEISSVGYQVEMLSRAEAMINILSRNIK